MRISLFAVGRLKSGPEKELAERYLDRFAKAGPAVGLELTKITEINESRSGNAEVEVDTPLVDRANAADRWNRSHRRRIN